LDARASRDNYLKYLSTWLLGVTICVAGAFVALVVTRFADAESIKLPLSDGWLTSASSDADRFGKLERQLRGFDVTMWEVGERFRFLHEALTLENYDLAAYHWEKIGTSMRNGIERRPARAASANAIFLGSAFEDVSAAFAQRKIDSAWQAFEKAKGMCQSCHVAEKVTFINQQRLFELAKP
jgi:hypothetical protein